MISGDTSHSLRAYSGVEFASYSPVTGSMVDVVGRRVDSNVEVKCTTARRRTRHCSQ